MEKLKLLIWMSLVSAGVLSFVWKFELLKKEGPRQELVLEEKNQDFELTLYRERFITGTIHTGFAKGPQLLQKSGSLKEILSELLESRNLEFDFKDDRQYNLEVRSSVPLEEIQTQIAEFVFQGLALEYIREYNKSLPYYTLTIQDQEKATEGKREISQGVLTYKEVKNKQVSLLGFNSEELVDQLNNMFPEVVFLDAENNNSPLYISLSDGTNLEKVIRDLQNQGINLKASQQNKRIKVIGKVNT